MANQFITVSKLLTLAKQMCIRSTTYNMPAILDEYVNYPLTAEVNNPPEMAGITHFTTDHKNKLSANLAMSDCQKLAPGESGN